MIPAGIQSKTTESDLALSSQKPSRIRERVSHHHNHPCEISLESSPHTLHLPDIPPDRWSDFRQRYEQGMTLKAIAQEFFCDPRTVRRLLLLNKGSSQLGQRHVPTVLSPFLQTADKLFQAYQQRSLGICQISQEITQQLRKQGYTGSERTVRNYLRTKYHLSQNQSQHFRHRG